MIPSGFRPTTPEQLEKKYKITEVFPGCFVMKDAYIGEYVFGAKMPTKETEIQALKKRIADLEAEVAEFYCGCWEKTCSWKCECEGCRPKVISSTEFFDDIGKHLADDQPIDVVDEDGEIKFGIV